MAATGNVIGKVASVQGQAFARAKDGTQRPLKVGDVVHENEVIVTGPGGRVELEFDNGKVFLLRANETVALDSAVVGSELPEPRNAALLDRVSELADITRAIVEGSSLDQLLEEAAAGLTGGSGNDGGHGFIQLLRIAEAIDPANFTFRFNPNDLGFKLPEDGNLDGAPAAAGTAGAGGIAATLTLSSATHGAAITEGGSITYTATLSSPVSGGPLVISLSNGATLTIPVGATSGSVTVAVRADDAHVQGTETLPAVSIASTSGGSFGSISA